MRILKTKQFIFHKQAVSAGLIFTLFAVLFLSLPNPASANTLLYKGVDVMKWTKDTVRNQPSDAEIEGIVAAIANAIKPTHIAISIPMDSSADFGSNTPSPRSIEDFTKKWADTIHAHGIKVIWRGTWSGIEGIYDFRKLHGDNQIPAGSVASAAREGDGTWLGKTYNYIIRHPEFFQNGDVWAALPERTEGIFWDSSSFLTHDGAGIRGNYENFFKDLKRVSDQAFAAINKDVVTGLTAQNYSEVASGWLSTGFYDNVGIVTVDHYGITHTPEEMEADIRKINKIQGKPIFLQEWGDYWHPHLSQSQRSEYLNAMYDVFRRLAGEGILVGFNYWGAWGGNQEGILDRVDGQFRINYRGQILTDFFGNFANSASPPRPGGAAPPPAAIPPPNQIVLPPNTSDGDVVKFGASPTVYLVKPDGLYPFDSLPSYLNYVSSSREELKVMSGSAFNYTTKPSLAREVLGQTNIFYPSGSLINDAGTIYLIRAGQKIGFTSMDAFLGLGYRLENVFTDNLGSYPLSTFKISSPNQEHPWGSWVINDATVYYTHQTGLIGVPDWQTFLQNGGQERYILPINAADLEILTNGPNMSALVSNDSRVIR